LTHRNPRYEAFSIARGGFGIALKKRLGGLHEAAACDGDERKRSQPRAAFVPFMTRKHVGTGSDCLKTLHEGSEFRFVPDPA
jgi:hypothetical protein